MKLKKIFKIFLVLAAIFISLRFPKSIAEGMTKGFSICIKNVIPSLLPFILITNYINSKNIEKHISKIIHPITKHIFCLSENGSFIFFIGLLCGYPMSAKLLGDFYTSNKLSVAECKYLATFCNNTSISFLFNYVGYYCLSDTVPKIKLLLLVFFPSLIVGIINNIFLKYKFKGKSFLQHSYKEHVICNDNIIKSSIISISTICIYVLLFSALNNIIRSTNLKFSNILTSINEITTGCKQISLMHIPDSAFFILCLVISGGLCIGFQVFSMIKNKEIFNYYIIGKIECIFVYCILYSMLT